MLNCLTTNSLVSMSQFIEMFGDPIKNSKNLPSLKGEELFVFSSGKANTKANLSKEFPYDCYGGNGITGKSEQWLIDFPTIIVGRVGEYCGCVHKTQGKIWITDNAIFIKEYKEKVFNGEFLFYLMTYLDFHRLADETGQPKITQRPLLSTEYMVPNLSLQEQFVSIAHQADKSGFVSIKSQFIEMFGDPSIDTKWPTKKLKELGSLDRGVSKARPRNAPELLGGAYPLIQTGDITEAKLYIKDYHQTYSELGLAQSKMWKRGTLCITIAANIAQTAILDIDACFPDSVVGFIPNDVEIIFIHYWFSFIQQVLERQAPQTAQKNINLKTLSELDVIVPPKDLQSQFVNIVLQADKSGYGCGFKLAS